MMDTHWLLQLYYSFETIGLSPPKLLIDYLIAVVAYYFIITFIMATPDHKQKR